MGTGAGAGEGADAEVVAPGGTAEVVSDGTVAGNWGADTGVVAAVAEGKAIAGRGLGCGVEKEAWG